MRLASILVCLALMILPLGIRFFYVVFKLSIKGLSWMESLTTPTSEQPKIRKRTVLLVTLGYMFVFFAAICWAFYENTRNVDINLRIFIFIGTASIVYVAGILVWAIINTRKMVRDYQRAKGTSNLTMIEWQDSLHDSKTYPFEKAFLRQLIPVAVSGLLFALIIGIASYFLFR